LVKIFHEYKAALAL